MVFVVVPTVADTVTGVVPVAADALAVKVSVVVQVGVHEFCDNEEVTPLGSDEMPKVTACVVPDERVAVIAVGSNLNVLHGQAFVCLLYTSPSPRD